MSAFGLYEQLWSHRNCPVIIDDLDKLYEQRDCVRILKQLCSSAPVRRISWHTRVTRPSTGIPSMFETTSGVILIANEWRTLNADVRALEDRAIVLRLDPPNEELHAAIGSWFEDREVYDFIGSVLACTPPHLSIRCYLKGQALRLADFHDWRTAVLQMLMPDPALASVLRLHVDQSFGTEQERVEQFMAETGRSRPTYFRLKRKLRVSGRTI